MIHDFAEKYVSVGAINTENSQISIDRYFEIEQEVLWLRQSKEKSEAKLAELLIEIKSLSEKLARLKAQNEVLNNCWLKEQQEHIHAATQARVWENRAAFKDALVEELQQQVRGLEEHLNPAGEVA